MTQPPKKSALVTGASSGIGEAYAKRLAKDGYRVTIVARRGDRLDALARHLAQHYGADATALRADLTQPDQLRMVERHVAAGGPLDLLVNNAGFPAYMPFAQLPPDEAERLIDLHVTTVTRLTRAALPGMLQRGHGAVVNVASLLAFSAPLPPNPLPARATYAACKAYLVAFSQLLQHEVGAKGVRIQVLCPGVVESEFHAGREVPVPPRFSLPDEVVEASLQGLEGDRVICVPGLRDTSVIDDYWSHTQRVLVAGRAAQAVPDGGR
ncbi:MAG: SDR family oxidoreductase [SAR202 cluster bacterium]|nr:SDR family oxidoreductase [SAR202 cluster bacterium]